MRTFLVFIAFLLIVNVAWSIDPQINLPDVLITGERTMKAQLTPKLIDFSQYTHTDSIMDFTYTPSLLSGNLNQPLYTGTDHRGFLRALSGNKQLFSFRAGFRALNNPIIGFGADGYQFHLKEKWDQEFAHFQWNPDFGSFCSWISSQGTIINTPLSDSETEIFSGNIGLKQKQNSESFLHDSEIKLIYINTQQDAESFQRIQDYNFFAQTTMAFSPLFLSHFRYENINQHPQGVFSLQYNSHTILRSTALWSGADHNHIYPSIHYKLILPLSYKFDLFSSNDPYMKKDGINEIFRVNPYQYANTLRIDDRQEKAILNARVGVEYHSMLHFIAVHQVSYKQDMPIYANLSGSLYGRFLNDCLVQTSSVNVGYGIKSLSIENKISYNQYKIRDFDIYWLPYEGTWKDDLSITYHNIFGYSQVSGQYETGRKDHLNRRIEDMLLVSFSHDIPIHKNVMINVNMDNVLNHRNIIYNEVPWLPFSARIGGTVTF